MLTKSAEQEVVREIHPAAARLDAATEKALFERYMRYFQHAEDERSWNLWEEIPWQQSPEAPADERLITLVKSALDEEYFLPDLSVHLLRSLRSSRGRGWFVTRWTYEEGKHALALEEWLMQRGQASADSLKDRYYVLLSEWEWAMDDDPLAIMLHVLLREEEEIVRYTELHAAARTAGDPALIALAEQILADENAHREMLRDLLITIRARYPEQVAAALDQVAGQLGPEKTANLAGLRDSAG